MMTIKLQGLKRYKYDIRVPMNALDQENILHYFKNIENNQY